MGRDNGSAVENPARRYLESVATALLLRKQCDESLLDRGGAGGRLEFGRRSGRKHFSGVHGGKPVETLGFLHIGCRHDDAHAGPAGAYAVNQFPELAAGKRVDAGGGLIQNKQIRIMNQRAAQPEFLAHASRQLLGRAIFKGRQARAVQQFRNSPFALVAGLPEQSTKKLDILADTEVRIEILPQPLWHVGDPRTYQCPVSRIENAATEDLGAARLDLTRASDDAEKRGFSDPIGTNQPNHAIGRYADRDAVQCRDLTVFLREAVEDGNSSTPLIHGAPCRFFGQATFGSARR